MSNNLDAKKKDVAGKMSLDERRRAHWAKMGWKKADTSKWPKANKEATKKSQKADPHWEMADRPELTKGSKIFSKYNK